MTGRLFVTGAGAVTHAGLGLDAVRAAWAGAPAAAFTDEEPVPGGEAVTVGRIGRLDDADCAASYKRWGQLDTYSRYGFVAARLALADAGVGDDAPGRDRFGVMLGTTYGCMEENQRFDRYSVTDDGTLKGASPLLFKGTVDNAPAGWIAVAWRLKGPNATFVSGDGAALEALWSAEGVLRKNRAPAVLVGGVERFVDLHLLLREADPARQGAVLAEGAGLVLLEREDSLSRRGGRARAELAGTARTRGTLADARAAALKQLGVATEDVGLSIDGTPGGAKARLGESHGAWGGIALCAALTQIEDGALGGRPFALVHAFGEGDEHFFAALKQTDRE